MAGYVHSNLKNAVYLLNCNHKLKVLFKKYSNMYQYQRYLHQLSNQEET